MQEFSEYLVDKITKAGFAYQDAKDKAKDFNIWPQLGFSFEELKSGCFDHFRKMDRGECTASEGYPQIIIVNENSKLAQSVAMARLSSKVGMGLRTQSCSGMRRCSA